MSYRITDRCIGCTLCARNCPVGAITGKPKGQHQIKETRCVECGVCGRGCPVGAILRPDGSTAEKVPRPQWKKPVIDTDRCSACSMCVNECGFDCLAISLPLYRGDLEVYAELKTPAKCVGCALCAEVCPLHCITMEGGDPA